MNKNNDQKYVYSIVPRRETYANAEASWIKHVDPDILCTACKRINDKWFPKPVDVVPRDRLTGWMPGMWWVSVTIMHCDLYAILRPFLSHFAVGRCLDSSGRESNKYITLYHRPYILTHGEEKSFYRSCSVCGSTWFNIQHQRTIRALASDFDSLPIRQDSTGITYVTEPVADVIIQTCFKKIKLIRIGLDETRPRGWTGEGRRFDYRIPVPW